jgi:hypothetical protein
MDKAQNTSQLLQEPAASPNPFARPSTYSQKHKDSAGVGPVQSTTEVTSPAARPTIRFPLASSAS